MPKIWRLKQEYLPLTLQGQNPAWLPSILNNCPKDSQNEFTASECSEVNKRAGIYGSRVSSTFSCLCHLGDVTWPCSPQDCKRRRAVFSLQGFGKLRLECTCKATSSRQAHRVQSKCCFLSHCRSPGEWRDQGYRLEKSGKHIYPSFLFKEESLPTSLTDGDSELCFKAGRGEAEAGPRLQRATLCRWLWLTAKLSLWAHVCLLLLAAHVQYWCFKAMAKTTTTSALHLCHALAQELFSHYWI